LAMYQEVFRQGRILLINQTHFYKITGENNMLVVQLFP